MKHAAIFCFGLLISCFVMAHPGIGIVKEIEPAEGFLSNYSFARDSTGNMYWVERFTVSRFMKKTPGGTITKLAEGKFGFIGWLYSTAGGTLYFIESNKLQKLTPEGKITVVAGDLMTKTTDFSIMGHNYDGYGIWTDAAGNVYIAMIAAKKINRISPDGKVQTIISSNSLWTATSGLFDHNGDLWLLESSMTNETRVRKLTKEELNNSVVSPNRFVQTTHLMVTIGAGITIATVWFLLRLAIKKTRPAWSVAVPTSEG